ncbi:tyrosine--tRNA ligase [Haliangium ochraceum]|uniref:Tyrosine--tRNA ligase n=1 Tax=Haliangium ochraceum (strain DSM 14365 / JCM 11303 / SMP-2) TaxID=502025 RepID=D0LGK8_HALO1|nr:tyrosine--tRNA ligase [Haliangium ochraceum]ACY12754.1 tyrosyl-tRNA synthetase [Haliangium ochraceum DSM 14365]
MSSKMTIIDELETRHLLQDVSHREELGELLQGEAISVYAGYDPTATSLHVGNLIPTIILARLQRIGCRPIALVGGATGMIGDPTGKSDERNLLDEDTLQANVAAIRAQLGRFFDFDDSATGAKLVNNLDWFRDIGFIPFLRDIGKLLTVNYMTAKDSVRSRLEDRATGISYTEFSYMLLQAYDFVHLAKEHGCRLQVGGSDQWGNITAGIELQRKLGRESVYGLTGPLLLDSSGEKMGKTASGMRIWLDPERTSPYAFYQYWLNTPDDDVARLLRVFSWRSLDEIDELVRAHGEAPQKRLGQSALAEDLTDWVHGEEAKRNALAASQVMFGGSLENLNDAALQPLTADLPTTSLPRQQLESGIPLLELLAQTKLAASKGAARRLVQGGGVYVNNIRVADVNKTLLPEDLGTETIMILRAGKKNYHLVQFPNA